MSTDLSLYSKKLESTELNITESSYQDYSTKPKSHKKCMVTDTIRKLQCVFESPIQNFETKKIQVDKEIVDLKENLYNLLESIQKFEHDINDYKESLNQKSQEKNLVKIKSHNVFKSSNDPNVAGVNNKKIINNKSSLNLGKVNITENNINKNEPKKTNLKSNDTKQNSSKKPVTGQNEKKITNLNKPVTPIRLPNTNYQLNENSKRTNKSDLKNSQIQETNNNISTHENAYKTNKSFIDRPSSNLGKNYSKTDKKSNMIKLTPLNKNEVKHRNFSPFMKDKISGKLMKGRESENKSCEGDGSLILNKIESDATKENLTNSNLIYIVKKGSKYSNSEGNTDIESPIKQENLDNIANESSKKIEIDINQIPEGKIEDFGLENMNLEPNILNTDVSHISELTNTRELHINQNLSVHNINIKSETLKTTI